MRETVLGIITTSEGISSVDLALKVMATIGPSKFEPDKFNLTLAQLVHGNQIIEVEFILPRKEYTPTKAIYFPKGTRLGINNGGGL